MGKNKLEIKNRDLVMIGIILGIMIFFAGAIVSNVFSSSQEDYLSYKVSAFLKLMGIGILTASMIVGGIIIVKIDKNLKMLLFLLGLVLLIIYTIGSPMLSWDTSNSDAPEAFSMSGSESNNDSDQTAYDQRPEALGTPGFEAILVISSIGLLIAYKHIKNKRL
jgi:hypothetical protein